MVKSRPKFNMKRDEMYRLAVVGNPVAHSLSPLIWQTFAKDCNIDLEYNKIHSEIDSFEQVVKEFFAANNLALNITAPFKSRAFMLANRHGIRTQGCLTANLLVNKNGEIYADNTDGVGLLDDLIHRGAQLRGKNILILGNGSVIHSVLSELESQHPTRIDLLMRNWDNLVTFEQRSNLVSAYDDDVCYELIINTTPNVVSNDLFKKVKQISADAIAYDMIYTAKQTLFLAAMEQLAPDVKQFNGIGMLIQQAKVAFNEVFSIMPATEHLYPLLQAHFND